MDTLSNLKAVTLYKHTMSVRVSARRINFKFLASIIVQLVKVNGIQELISFRLTTLSCK